MTLKNILCFILYLSIISRIIPATIELSNYSEIKLKDGYSEFSYFYVMPKTNFYSNPSPYVFIKFTNYQEIDMNILINREQYYYNLPKENEEWIDILINKWKYENKINFMIYTKKKYKNDIYRFIKNIKNEFNSIFKPKFHY